MAKLIAFFIIVLCFVVLFSSKELLSWFKQFRRRDLYQENRKLTMFDVRQLLLEKEKDLAIDVYRDIFQTTRQDAEKAVEELERSIQAKNSDSA